MQNREDVRERAIATKSRGPQCNQISESIAWRNKKFTFDVCATSAAKAAQKVTNQVIVQKITSEADAAISLDCSSGESCGDTQRCLPGDVQCNNINVTIRPKAANCRPAEGGDCTAPETAWQCDIWADVDASKQCGCRVP